MEKRSSFSLCYYVLKSWYVAYIDGGDCNARRLRSRISVLLTAVRNDARRLRSRIGVLLTAVRNDVMHTG